MKVPYDVVLPQVNVLGSTMAYREAGNPDGPVALFRALLVAPIARGRRWLEELLADANANTETIAKRERCSVRKVNMTISLAFLAPDLVKAAIAGRLPHGMGVARLADMPAEWSRQHQMLGLPSA